MKEFRSEACKEVQKAANTKAWEIMEGPLRIAVRDLGYSLTLHGSLARDIDLVAIPWRDYNVATIDHLLDTIVGVLRGIFGRANKHGSTWTEKPHGRLARTILIWGGWSIDIDLSVMPTIEKPKEEDV